MPTNKRVLITGIAGLIGGVLRRFLKDRWDLTGIDLVPVPDTPSLVEDINNKDSMTHLLKDAYAVVHLAGNPNWGANWDEIIRTNIKGTGSVFEAAKDAGVQKIIFASSNQVTGLYEEEEPYRSIVEGRYENKTPEAIPRIKHTSTIRPNAPYGISKAFGEALGRYYSQAFRIEVICLRIGTVNRENRPLLPRHFATFLSHRDLASLIDACLDADNVPFDIFYGVSSNTWRFWDIEHPKAVLGWAPKDNAEMFRNAKHHANLSPKKWSQIGEKIETDE